MIEHASADRRREVFAAASGWLERTTTASVGVVITSPPYGQRGRGLASAERFQPPRPA